MEQFVKTVSGFLWGNYMIILCLVVGVFFAIKTKFFWLRYLKESIRLVKEKNTGGKEGVSPMQAFCMALAGRIGTGNHRRRGNCYRGRRPRCSLLDVDSGIFRSRYIPCRVYAGTDLQGEKIRRVPRRSCFLYGEGSGTEVAGCSLCPVLRDR